MVTCVTWDDILGFSNALLCRTVQDSVLHYKIYYIPCSTVKLCAQTHIYIYQMIKTYKLVQAIYHTFSRVSRVVQKL